MTPDPTQRTLGRIEAGIEGLQHGQAQLHEKLETMDQRLRSVETRAATTGAVSGGVMAVGFMLITETLKGWVGRGGGNG